MTPEELKTFANDIAIPIMKELLEETTLEDGECYIDNLSIEFIDGRSWGVDSLIKATGLIYEGGIVKEFQYEETDVSVDEFVEANKGCILISDGKMDVKDELEQVSLSGTIGSGILHFPKICPHLKYLEKLNCIPKSIEFYKMTYLFLKQMEAEQEPVERENPLDEKLIHKNVKSRIKGKSLSMLVDFKILKRNEDGCFVPMNNEEARSVSIGGFSFDVDGKSIPFDWDACYGTEHDNVFGFETGRGLAFIDFELADYYADMGIKRENLTAECLASTNHIEEFFVDFEDGDKVVGVGCYNYNLDNDAQYKLQLIEISFKDMDTGKIYDVKPDVLKAFNKGERGKLALDEQIKNCAVKASIDRDDKDKTIEIGEER